MTGLFAYIDPGSGSFILQVIVGAVLGVSVAAKMYWGRLRHLVASRFARRSTTEKQGE